MMTNVEKCVITITPETHNKRTITLRLLKPSLIDGQWKIKTKTNLIGLPDRFPRYVVEIVDQNGALPNEVWENTRTGFDKNKNFDQRGAAVEEFNCLVRNYQDWCRHEDNVANGLNSGNFWQKREHPWH